MMPKCLTAEGGRAVQISEFLEPASRMKKRSRRAINIAAAVMILKAVILQELFLIRGRRGLPSVLSGKSNYIQLVDAVYRSRFSAKTFYAHASKNTMAKPSPDRIVSVIAAKKVSSCHHNFNCSSSSLPVILRLFLH